MHIYALRKCQDCLWARGKQAKSRPTKPPSAAADASACLSSTAKDTQAPAALGKQPEVPCQDSDRLFRSKMLKPVVGVS